MIPNDQKQSFIDDLFAHFTYNLFLKNGTFDIGGNGVVIAPNIAITAAHTIKNNKFNAFSNFDFTNPSNTKFYANESLNIVVRSKKYKAQYVFKVEHVIFLKDTDLAILYLKDITGNAPKDLWNDIVIRLTPPNIGNHVFTLGTVFKDKSYEYVNGVLNLNPEYVASLGGVTQFMLNHPQSGAGFYSRLTTPNTLSGAPVFNKDKELVGLISRGYNNIDDPLAFVSLLYPYFISKYMYNDIESRHLHKLAETGEIICKDIDVIEIAKNDADINLFLPEYTKSL